MDDLDRAPLRWMSLAIAVHLVAAPWPTAAASLLGLLLALRWRRIGAAVVALALGAAVALAGVALTPAAAVVALAALVGVAAAVAWARTVPPPDDAPGRAVLLIDGTCLFCHRLVAWILRRDPRGVFRFAHLQGALGRAVLARHGIDPPDLDGVYVVVDPGTPGERLLVDGAAGRFIYPRILGTAGELVHLVPLPLLDLWYRAFARVRYRLFGQADACLVPTAADRARFLAADGYDRA
jgi:predicted DCC family thiol-disulfide oxidoreductase YuxK